MYKAEDPTSNLSGETTTYSKRARVLPSIKATSRRTMIIGDQYALESQSLLYVTHMFSKKPGSN